MWIFPPRGKATRTFNISGFSFTKWRSRAEGDDFITDLQSSSFNDIQRGSKTMKNPLLTLKTKNVWTEVVSAGH